MTDHATEARRAKWRKYWHSLTPEQRAEIGRRARERRKKRPEVYRAQDQRRQQRIAAHPERREKKNAVARAAYARRQAAKGRRVVPRDTRPKSPRPKPEPLPCVVCGEPRPARNKRYCSPICARLARLANQRQSTDNLLSGTEVTAIANATTIKKYELPCVHCGKTFRANVPYRLYCAPRCAKNAINSRRRRGETSIPIVCIVCGEIFAADRRNATTCSPTCRAEAKRAAMRERAKDPEVVTRSTLLARKRKKVTTHCVACGRDTSDFANLRINRYTCSAACRKEALRRKNRRTYERRRNRKQ